MIYQLAVFANSRFHSILKAYILWQMRTDLNNDPELMAKLLPDYPLGCKRITPSDEYIKSKQLDEDCLV